MSRGKMCDYDYLFFFITSDYENGQNQHFAI